MITQYKVWIYKEDECTDCGRKIIRDPIFMHVIPNKETAKEIAELLKQHLEK